MAPAGAGGQLTHRVIAFPQVVETEGERMPGITELRAAPDGGRGGRSGCAADPDWRVRLLHRARRERGAGEGEELALVGWDIGGPGSLDGADVVVAHPASPTKRQPEIVELLLVPANAHSEDEASSRGLIDGG